jgi:hypothetical protein
VTFSHYPFHDSSGGAAGVNHLCVQDREEPGWGKMMPVIQIIRNHHVPVIGVAYETAVLPTLLKFPVRFSKKFGC